MNKGILISLLVVLAVVAGGGLEYTFQIGERLRACWPEKPPMALEQASQQSYAQYVCPMHPAIVRGAPGDCPICRMDLVPVQRHDNEHHADITLAHEVNHAEVQTAPGPADENETDLGAALAQAVNHVETQYVCSMHPQVVRAEPGDCPICGMHLVPMHTHEEAHAKALAGSLPVVRVTSGMVNRLGVRTAEVEHQTLQRRVDTVGYVEYDRDKLRHVYSAAEGSIVNLAVRSEGERVQKGQFLFELDSPKLSRYFGKVFAEQGGIIANLPVIEGTWALPTDIVMTIADLSSVWVLADVFEGQAGWVQVGQRAEVRLPSVPERMWQGKVEYIYPNLDPETRTLKVRMRFDNPDEVLKPNMLAEVVLYGEARPDVLAVPREALIETGKHQRVIVALGEGRFQPRQVTAGMENDKWVEIIDGLHEDERVVVSGQFLIDSESSLQASLMRMTTATTPQHTH